MKEILENIFLLGGIQGLLLSIILLTKKENHIPNRILAITMFTLSLDLFAKIYYSREMYFEYPHLMGITYPFPYLYGPIFYIYAKLISKKEENFELKNLLHFLPAIIVYLLCIPVYSYSSAEKIEFVKLMAANTPPPLFAVINKVIPFQGIFYTIITIKVVTEYNRSIKEKFSNIERINLIWLKNLTIGITIIWSIVAVMHIVSLFVKGETGVDYILYAAISILVYAIGYMGLKQPEIFMKVKEERDTGNKNEKYAKSGLDDADAEEIKNRLLSLMEEEKPYLDSELTLNKMAENLSVSNHHLSEVINSKLNCSYFDFINKYRVEEFKNRVIDPAYKNYSLLSIAFDSGFKSKTSFNTIFKKLTNMTPSEYKNSAIPAEK